MWTPFRCVCATTQIHEVQTYSRAQLVLKCQFDTVSTTCAHIHGQNSVERLCWCMTSLVVSVLFIMKIQKPKEYKQRNGCEHYIRTLKAHSGRSNDSVLNTVSYVQCILFIYYMRFPLLFISKKERGCLELICIAQGNTVI